MNSVPMPNISKNFTVDDIHKIREWNLDRRRGMSVDEVIADMNKGADEFRRLMKSAPSPQSQG